MEPIPRRVDGLILWLTGLSGAGKSTLAEAIRDRLAGVRAIEILDGDEVRAHLSADLGFSKADRDTNIRRIGFVARMLARHGVLVITAAISPYAAARDEVRDLALAEGIEFVDVHVNASLEALIERDVKGLYRRALTGDIAHFTGVSDPYEPPTSPAVVVHTHRETVSQSVERILDELARRGITVACSSMS